MMRITHIKSLLFINLFVSIALTSMGQSQIDFENKLISKEIIKTYAIEAYTETIYTTTKSLLQNGLNGKLSVINCNDKNVGFSFVGRVNSCRAGGCSINKQSTDQGFEYFDYIILFDTNGIVKLVKVFNYQATHGHEICSKGWLKQFEGYQSSNNLRVGKEVDAISGATISVYGITANICTVSTLLTQLMTDTK